MSVKQILKDNIEAVVECVHPGSPGYPPEYEYNPDRRVMGLIAQYLVNGTTDDDPIKQQNKEAAFFHELADHFGIDRIGQEIMEWYKAPVTVHDQDRAAASLRIFVTWMLIKYAENLAEKHDQDIIAYYEEIQREHAEAKNYSEDI